MVVNPFREPGGVTYPYLLQKSQFLGNIFFVEPRNEQAPLHNLVQALILGFILRDFFVMIVPPAKEQCALSIRLRFFAWCKRVRRGGINPSGLAGEQESVTGVLVSVIQRPE